MNFSRRLVATNCLLIGALAASASVSCGDATEPNPGAGGSGTAGSGTPQAGSTGKGGSAGATATGGTTGGVGTGGTGGGTGGTVTTGGSSGTGGSTGGGSSGSTGATAGSGGTSPMGGSAGMPPNGGMPGTGGTGTGGTGQTATCTFNITPATTAAKIPTVGIVQFSTDLAGVTGARIEFGLDTSYGMTAPVDMAAPNYRTLLLGMKQRSTYHYRIVATGPAGECASEDQTVMTGALPNGSPTIDVDTRTNDKSKLYGGFLITGAYAQGGGGSGSPGYIIDADGDVVWAFQIGSDVTGARMSYDGKYMWLNKANVPNGQANVHRVSMDGETDENLSQQFTGQNHVMDVLPDESVAFFAYGQNGCDDVKIRTPNGMTRTVVNSGMAHGASGSCHLNGISYSPEDETLVFSDLNHSNLTKVKLDGTVVWVIGGPTNDFMGQGTTWPNQHGVHVLGVNRILFFMNNTQSIGGGNVQTEMPSGSKAIEILLDTGAMSASRVWQYDGSESNQIMGDVQRLKNGNTIIAYSTVGVLEEVSETKEVLERWEWASLPGAFGYVEKRKTLYGPPER